MKTDNSFWIKAYQLLDYAPVISTITNGIDAIFRNTVLKNAPSDEILKSKYYTYITTKEVERRALPFVPVLGNLSVLYYDLSHKKYDDPAYFLDKKKETFGAEIVKKASDRLKNDREFFLKVVAIKPDAYLYAGELIRYDRELMDAAVRGNPKLLEYTDNTYILETLRKQGTHLQYLSDFQRNDWQYVEAALENDLKALKFSQKYSNDESFILKLMSDTLTHTGPEFTNDAKGQRKFIRNKLEEIYNLSGNEFRNIWRKKLDELEQNPGKFDEKDPYHNNPYFRLMATHDSELVVKRFTNNQLKEFVEDDGFENFVIKKTNKETLGWWGAGDSRHWRIIPFFKEVIAKQVPDTWAEFWNDEQKVKRICQAVPELVEFANPRFRESKDFMRPLIERSHVSLRHVSEDLKNDKEFMLPYLKESPWLLEFASEALRKDPDFVTEVLSQKKDPRYILWADPSLLKDAAFLERIVNQYPKGFSEAIADQSLLVLAYIKADPSIFRKASPRLQGDLGFIAMAIEKNPKVIAFVNPNILKPETVIDSSIKNDRAFLLPYLKEAPQLLSFASKALRRDPNFIEELLSLKQDLRYILWADASLQRDEAFLARLAQKYPNGFNENVANHEGLVLAYSKVNPSTFQRASPSLRNNFEFVARAIEQNPGVIAFVDPNLLKPETVLELMYINPQIFPFLSNQLRQDPKIAAVLRKEKI